jgi:CSLREA domain-containing protein
MSARFRFALCVLASVLATSLVASYFLLFRGFSPAIAGTFSEAILTGESNRPLAPPSTIFTVTTIIDENDGDCLSYPGDCSLRDAILLANASVSGDVINFLIIDCGGPDCTITISPTLGALPSLTGGYITINGFSQPEISGRSIRVIVDGGNNINGNGFNITSNRNTIKGLSIQRFKWAGISIWGAAATNNTISGNNIGLDASGAITRPNAGGVVIGGQASNNTIGGDEEIERNLISGNTTHGVWIAYTSTLNIVSGNYIGTDDTGTVDLGNGGDGVYISDGAYLNTIGGNSSAKGNIISGNDLDGVGIYGTNTVSNTVSANKIGLDEEGLYALSNNSHGVNIYGGSKGNVIGGTSTSERNLIAGNNIEVSSCGVHLAGSDTRDNTIMGNHIGTNYWGNTAYPNRFGVSIENGAHHNTIGGDTSGEGNLISGNSYNGVSLSGSGTDFNVISANFIGADWEGHSALAIGWVGVYIGGGAKYNTIGGDSVGERNLISGNTLDGVYINGSDTLSNTVSGNYIGTTVDGAYGFAIENGWYGVRIDGGASYNLIGGDTSAVGNLISGNDRDGVRIAGAETMSNTISANFIGTDASGDTALTNHWYGITITDSAKFNRVGGDGGGETNLISGNSQGGLRACGLETSFNFILGNIFGLNAAGTSYIGSPGSGITLRDGAHHNTVGGDSAGERNIISGYFEYGVIISSSNTSQNVIIGNYIGTDPSGSVEAPNNSGIMIGGGAHDNHIGGDSPGEGNLISGNNNTGIEISDSGTTGNIVQGNDIGVDASGASDLGNFDGVVVNDGAQNNIIGPDNLIAYNDSGVSILYSNTLGITITQNSIFSNSDGIILYSHANGDIAYPEIAGTASGSVIVTGTACSLCLVELFSNPEHVRQGKHYQGSNHADASGHFTITVGGLLWPYLTATATDPISGTSEFSLVYEADNRGLFLPVVMKNYSP